MQHPPHAVVLESDGLQFLRGDLFYEEYCAAANEIMRRSMASQAADLFDDVYHFRNHVDSCVDELLVESNCLPELGSGVPVASWVLARLRVISPGYVLPEVCLTADGGGYSFDLYVLQASVPVGWGNC